MSYKVQLPSPRTIIIETHSEHLILRILRRIRETSEGNPHDGIAVAPGDVSVCYVSQEDGQSVPRTIRIDDQGDFIDKWPRGFFEERAGELFS
jgi:predicted ATPase